MRNVNGSLTCQFAPASFSSSRSSIFSRTLPLPRPRWQSVGSGSPVETRTVQGRPCTVHSLVAFPAESAPSWCTLSPTPALCLRLVVAPVAPVDFVFVFEAREPVSTRVPLRCMFTYSVTFPLFLEQLPPQNVFNRLVFFQHSEVVHAIGRRRGASIVPNCLRTTHDNKDASSDRIRL